MSKPEPTRYRTTNWKAYNEALKRRGSLLIWLDKDMVWRAPKAGRNGRPSMFSGGEDRKNNPANCFPDERDPVLLDGEGSVRPATAANDWDGGEHPVDGRS